MYKYRIKEWIEKRGHDTAFEKKELRTKLCEACKIRRETLSHWENIRPDDKKMVPANQLLTISKVLQINVDQLFDYVEMEAQVL